MPIEDDDTVRLLGDDTADLFPVDSIQILLDPLGPELERFLR
jgi:hypothetical protein